MITNMHQLVNHMEMEYADRIAFQYVQDGVVKQVTYRQYCRDLKSFAASLQQEFPDVQGKHIAILAKTSYAYIVWLFGIILAGGVAIPLNNMDTIPNIHYALSFSDTTLLLTDGTILKEEDMSEHKGLVWKTNPPLSNENPHKLCISDGNNDNHLAIMLFTSGTFGNAKSVMFSQKSIFTPTEPIPTPSMLLTMPIYHVAGIGLITAFNTRGRCINICESMKYIDRDMVLMPSSGVFVVPSILSAWKKDISRGNADKLKSLKVIACGAAPADPCVFAAFEKQGIQIRQCYGMTEAFNGGTQNTYGRLDKMNSVGTPLPGCDVKIEDGEVYLKSDAVMLGYYKDETSTQEILQDDWLHTGDLGYLDEDGYLYLTGRKKNLIILSSGENVSPEELEAEFTKCPLIIEGIVKEKNDRICAEIYCDTVHQEDIRFFISEANKGKPFYKRITNIEFRNTPFKRTSTGKILRSQQR